MDKAKCAKRIRLCATETVEDKSQEKESNRPSLILLFLFEFLSKGGV